MLVTVDSLHYSAPGGAFRLCIPTFTLERGETVGLVGRSGCGKTTFLHLLAGILVPASGRVLLDGTDVARLPEAERRRLRGTAVGLVFQEFELLEYLDVAENVALPAWLHRDVARGIDVPVRVAELAAATGLAGLLARRPRALSQGERQRAALCRALLADPPLLLADEPTGNLDPATARSARDLLLREARRRGAALLVVSHDHALFDGFDRVVDLEALAAPAAAAGAGAS